MSGVGCQASDVGCLVFGTYCWMPGFGWQGTTISVEFGDVSEHTCRLTPVWPGPGNVASARPSIASIDACSRWLAAFGLVGGRNGEWDDELAGEMVRWLGGLAGLGGWVN